MHVRTTCPQNQHFPSNMTPNQHRVGGKGQSGAIYMRTIYRLGPHVERKQDTISSHWVPRPSGSGFHGIPWNPQSAYYSIACTGLLPPSPVGKGAGGEGFWFRQVLSASAGVTCRPQTKIPIVRGVRPRAPRKIGPPKNEQTNPIFLCSHRRMRRPGNNLPATKTIAVAASFWVPGCPAPLGRDSKLSRGTCHKRLREYGRKK